MAPILSRHGASGKPGAVQNHEGLPSGAYVDIEVVLGDIEANEEMVQTRPCNCGLLRPERLCGFTVRTVERVPRFRPAFADQGDDGLPPTTLTRSILSMDPV
jgi:hypothetical protein